MLILAIITISPAGIVHCQNSTFVKPDKIARFDYNGKGAHAYIREHFRYPKEAVRENIEGISIVSFTIGADGRLRKPYISKSAHPLLDKEALRIIKTMKKWTPAMKDGKPMEMKMGMPFKFSICTDPDQEAVFTYKGLNEKEFIESQQVYPEEAWRNGIEGICYIEAFIGEDGTLYNARIGQPTHPLLDKAALKVVKKMKKWQPAMKDGEPITSRRVVLIRFSLGKMR